MEPVVDEGIRVWAGDDVNGAAMSAVAAARSTARHPLLASERKAAAPSVTGFDVNVDFVNEHRKSGDGGDLVIA